MTVCDESAENTGFAPWLGYPVATTTLTYSQWTIMSS